jgi:hypothetical protein
MELLKELIALWIVLLLVVGVTLVFYPLDRTSNQADPIITPNEKPTSHPDTPKPPVCRDGDTRDATCPDGVTMYFNKYCMNGEWRQVMYIGNPCEPIPTTTPVPEDIYNDVTDGWKNDGIILMQHETEGYFACFGCSTPSEGPAMCIDPIPEMKQVTETEERYCNSNFELVEKG